MDFSMKILIADDYSSMRRILKTSLKQIGFYNFIEADDGSSAMELLKYHKIGLIISDWEMPKMKGIDFLKAVRCDPEYEDIPFLMVTAEKMPENIMDAIEAGVSNYVVKPFSIEVLTNKINQIFKEA